MNEIALKGALDQALCDLTFTEEMKERVRARMIREEVPRAPVRRVFPRALIAAAVCGALLVTALAAAPTIWELIQSHLGAQAPYASQTAGGTVSDQGVELGVAAALADENVVRVYLTLRDLEGERFADGRVDTDLFGWPKDFEVWDPEAYAGKGGEVEVVGYDGETKTLTLCRPFYSRQTLTDLHVRLRTLTPGYRTFRRPLTGSELEELVPREILESAVDGSGNRYLLPDQNPAPLDEAETGVSISSMGYAEDGRFHVRLKAAQGVTFEGADGFLLSSMGASGVAGAVLPDGVDYVFPQDFPGREDLSQLSFLIVHGGYSTQGGTIHGSWDLDVALEPVESRSLTWPGGTVTNPIWGTACEIQAVRLSPLVLAVDYVDPAQEGAFLDMTPEAVLADGTTVEGVYLKTSHIGERGVTVWEFPTPLDLEQVDHVTLAGRELAVDQP